MILIDGSAGEGGGQILRSALALAMATGTPFRMEKVRAGRAKPGLLRQHLTAVNAAQLVSSAEVEGAHLGSSQITFRPGAIRPGEYEFAIGSAGSATLVLQTVLPPLLTASKASRLTLGGGTHNPMAPPFDFLQRVFLPLIGRMGPLVTAQLLRPGFYPAGGGKFTVDIEPVPRLARLDLPERGEIRSTHARAIVVNLPAHIAERELHVVQRRLGWDESSCETQVSSDGRGPGNVLILEIVSEHLSEVCTGFGEIRRSAEAVAERAVEEARRYLAAQVPVGCFLADQLLLPLALAGGGSFLTLALTRHATTNIDIVRRFLDVPITTTRSERDRTEVTVGQAG